MDFDDVSQNENNEEQNQLDEILFLDQDQLSTQYISLKDCVIFLLDCSKSMHQIQNSIQTTGITSVLTVAQYFLKTKIITNEKDLFGLVLFNTSLMKNEMNFEGVNQLINITPPDANLIKKIKNYEQLTNPILLPKEYENNLKENDILYIETLPVIIADFIQSNSDYVIINNELDDNNLNNEIKSLFDSEIVKKIENDNTKLKEQIEKISKIKL